MSPPADRRSEARRSISIEIAGVAAAERPLPRCSTIDASSRGILVAFDEPVGLSIDDRILLSLALCDGRCHLLGSIRRVARGIDFRTYVAVDLSTACEEDVARLRAHYAQAARSGKASADAPGEILKCADAA